MTRHERGTGDRDDADRAEGPAATIDEVLGPSGGRRDLRRLPSLVARAVGLVWAAAPRGLVVAGVLQVAAGLSLVAQLLVLRRVLDRIAVTDGPPGVVDLAPELLAFGGLLVVVTVAAVGQREQQRTLGEQVQKYTTARVLDVSTQVELLDYDRPSFHDQLQRARVNASVRPLQIVAGVVGLLGSGVAVVAVGAALLYVEPLVAGLVALGAIPSLWLNRAASRALHGFSVRQTPGDRRRAYLYEVLSRKEEAQEVRAFDNSGHLRAEHDRLFDAKIEDLRAVARRRMVYGTLAGLVAAIVTIGSVAMLLTFVRVGRLAAGDAVVAVGAVLLIAGRLRQVIGSTGALYEGALFLEDFTHFVSREPKGSRSDAASRRSAPRVPAPFERLELDRVGFTYPSRDEPSLQDVSLSLVRGEVLALVGENGSGKTTLTKLLAGLYRPTCGTIRWDGRDIATVELAELREQVTVIFQDFARYFLTAHENVAISRYAHLDDDVRVREAAVRAGADGFLSSLPAGYASLLGPAFAGGSDLSTGQWQRIALARAYFRDAPLLILDEPTAALDPRGEYEIFQQVRELAGGRTVVLVSHRFSSVRVADRIVVLEAGRIVEEGDHVELVARGGLYAELFRLQAEGYRDPSS